MKRVIIVVAVLGVLSAAAAALAAGGRPITEKVLRAVEHLAASNSCETSPSLMGRFPALPVGGGRYGRSVPCRVGRGVRGSVPVWTLAFICR